MSRLSVDASVADIPSASVMLRCLVLALWVCSFCTAVGVVYVTYEARQHTQFLESLRREEIGLRVGVGQYQLEKSTLASYPRVESIATKKLNMISPESGETVLVIRE